MLRSGKKIGSVERNPLVRCRYEKRLSVPERDNSACSAILATAHPPVHSRAMDAGDGSDGASTSEAINNGFGWFHTCLGSAFRYIKQEKCCDYRSTISARFSLHP